MDRVGTVIEVKPHTAIVRLQRHLSCENCGRCGGLLGGPDQLDHLVEALNPINARAGQRVLIVADDRRVVFISFMLYLVPLAALISGIFLWIHISSHLGFRGRPELPAVAAGAFLMGLVYAGLRFWDNLIKDNPAYKPVIAALADEDEEPADLL